MAKIGRTNGNGKQLNDIYYNKLELKNHMRFSQRIGKTASSKEIQLDNIDDELRNRLWNILKIFYLDKLDKFEKYDHSEFIKPKLWTKLIL